MSCLSSRWKRSGSSFCTRIYRPPRHFPPSRRQPATISCSCNQFDVSPYKSHRVMQYNTWKRVSPSNPVSSHPAFCVSLSLFLFLALYPRQLLPSARCLRFVLKHLKSCARHNRTHRKLSLVVLSQMRIYLRSDFIRLSKFRNLRASESIALTTQRVVFL